MRLALAEHTRKAVDRGWECALHHYKHTKARLEREDLRQLLLALYNDSPRSLSAFDRAHRICPLLLPWPIQYGQRPPWEGGDIDDTPIDPRPVDLRDYQGEISSGQLVLGEDGPTVDGKPVRLEVVKGVVRVLGTTFTGVAATFSAIAIADGMDGTIDQTIHWCRVVLAGLAPHLTI